MNHYKAIIAYDGTDYAGWQVQPEKLAIANIMQNTFAKTFGKPIKLIGASRTDAGVHALGQVASFSTNILISPYQLQVAWNNLLPNSIVIRSLQKTETFFHPQAYVKQKTYWYHFFTARPLPFVERYGSYYRYALNIEKLKETFTVFTGTHDFRSFYTGNEQKNAIRTIDSISLQYFKRWNIYRVEIRGKSFLRFMIRRIVGACMDVASRNLPIALLQKVLEERDPNQRLPNAHAKGLMLNKIIYE
ncbi:MAG: tRNA pseudouridine(38-40) synthase TruA [Candidatus Babeliales bacterium]